jgi:hypothetical protein
VAVEDAAPVTVVDAVPAAHRDDVAAQATAAPAEGKPAEGKPSSEWSRMLADPAHTPELLADLAVARFGPRAAAWVAEVRQTYPAAAEDGIARLAAQRFGRRSTIAGALAGATGSLSALAGAGAWLQAELLLHVAAAYGRDPVDPERAADLLVLLRVHPGHADARRALNAARQPAGQPADNGVSTPSRADERRLAHAARLARPLATQLAGWVAARTVSRLLPGSAVLAAGLASRAAVQGATARAVAFYRTPPALTDRRQGERNDHAQR